MSPRISARPGYTREVGAIVAGITAVAAILALLSAVAVVTPRSALAQGGGRVSPCGITNNKWADPTRLVLGDWTTVALTTTTDCPKSSVPLHIVLSLDASLSMRPDGKLEQAQNAAKQFVRKVDFSVSRVGVTSFSDKAYIDTEMTDSAGRVLSAIDGLDLEFGTVIADGLDLSREMLMRARSDAPRDRPPVETIIILSDGRPYFDTPAEVQRAAAKIKSQDILLISICVGGDCDTALMRSIASRPNLFFDVKNASRLVATFNDIIDELLDTQLRLIEITDVVPDNMRYIEGSAIPEVFSFADNTLYWRWTAVPKEGITITYRLEPLEVGIWPTNVEAHATFRDTQNRIGNIAFPVPTVEGIAPTATPTPGPPEPPPPTPTNTPTNTPTATNTPVPRDIFLPISLREHCDPVIQATDVALVIDISTSMNGATRAGGVTKRAAAAQAARLFARRARGPGDQVAVIVFADEARVLVPLGASPERVDGALERLPRSAGTRIDAGLKAATLELTGPARRRGNRAAILLLTDGQPTRSTEAEVLAEAEAAAESDISVFTVGLGADVNHGLLRRAAGSERRYVPAPDAEALAEIYGRLAHVIPCPGGYHDWSRPWP